MWQYDPQYTSCATSKAVSYFDNNGKRVMNEYTGAKINSSGPIYADLEYSYVADSGAFKYTLRHTEFPHNDENRTYYTLSLTFLKDLTLNDVRSQFSILSQDSRDQTFSEISYIGSDGQYHKVALDNSFTRDKKIYTLQAGNGFYTYFHSNRDVPTGKITTETDPMNYAVIIKKSDIVIDGKAWTGNFVLRDSYGSGVNYSELSLDLGKTTFKNGDKIYIEFLMLPWASRDIASDANVLTVYEDSVQKPLTVTSVANGSVVAEPYLARILASDNAAQFTVSGGRSRNVIRVDGFTKLGRVSIEEILPDGSTVPYETSVKEYDGYGVYLGRDGTYSYAFVYEAETPETTRTFKVSVN